MRFFKNISHRVNKLKIYPSLPKFDNTKLPEKFRLPFCPKVPSIFMTHNIRPPKQMRETWRQQGEELVHNKLQLGAAQALKMTGCLAPAYVVCSPASQ